MADQKTNQLYELVYKIDGKISYVEKVEKGTRLTSLAKPTKDFHTFSGWESIPSRMPARDVVLEGKFTPNRYTLVFMVGEEEISRQELTYGAPIECPPAPEKVGYTFSGWSDVPETMPGQDLTVIGHRQPNLYRIHYVITDRTAGDVTTTFSVPCAYGEPIELMDEPVKKYCTFSGWSGVPATMPARDLTVTGTLSLTLYTLTRIVDGEVFKVEHLPYGAPVAKKPNPTKEGYYFSGFRSLPKTMPDHDVEVVSSMYPARYKADFLIDGQPYKTVYIPFGSPVEVTLDPHEGRVFTGWTDCPDLMPAHDIEVHGHWQFHVHRLSYRVMGEVVKTLDVPYGTPLDEPGPAVKGYLFLGWKDAPATMPDHDLVLDGLYRIKAEKVAYLIDGEEYAMYDSRELGDRLDAPAPQEREGFVFSGWEEVPPADDGDVYEIRGSYIPQTYEVTFLADDEVVEVVAVPYGERILAPTPPAKENHTFVGWSDLPAAMPAKNITVTASYTESVYRIAFVIGDEIITEYVRPFGTPVACPIPPEKQGHSFSGWMNCPDSMPNHELTVYGTYTPNEYKIVYILNGDPYRTDTLTYGAEVTPPQPVAEEGYRFTGWEALPETMPDGDIEVSGSLIPEQFRLTFVLDGEPFSELTQPFGSEIAPPTVPDKEGYRFVGWQDCPATMPADDLTVQGSYALQEYTLSWVAGGETLASYPVPYGTPLTLPDGLSIPRPEQFEGWGEFPTTMPNADLTIEAQYRSEFCLRFVVDGTVLFEALQTAGTPIVECCEVPPREGYHFTGWSGLPEGAAEDAPLLMPDHDLTLTGSYELNLRTVSYRVDGEVFAVTELLYGAPLSLRGAPAKDGYRFIGWTGLPEELSVELAEGGSVSMPDEDLVAEAAFVRVYPVRFYIEDQLLAEQLLAEGETIEVPSIPAKEGYTTAGFDEVPPVMPGEPLQLTATYRPAVYTATFMADGKVVEARSFSYDTPLLAPEPPAVDGCKFVAWQNLPQTMPAHDVLIEAAYAEDHSVPVTFMVDGEVLSVAKLERGDAIVCPPVSEKEGHTFGGWEQVPARVGREPLVLQGHYVPHVHTITYVVDDKTYSVQELPFGHPPRSVKEPVKEKHRFTGWQGLPERMPDEDLTVTAAFRPLHTLRFLSGSETVCELVLETGQAFQAPPPPFRYGHTFVAWDNLPEQVDGDAVVHARFLPNTNIISFLVDGIAVDQHKYRYGEAITPPAAPVKPGFTFAGWLDLPPLMPDEDLTARASFDKYHTPVQFFVDDELYQSYSVPYGAPLTLPESPTKEGHTFSGWGEVPATAPDHPLDLYGTLTPNLHRLTFVYEGQELSAQELPYGAPIVPPALPTPRERTKGSWGEVPALMPDRDLCIEAVITENRHPVRFYADDELVSEVSLYEGEPITLPQVTVPEGHRLSGWETVPALMGGEPLEFRAQTVPDTYRVTFKAQGRVLESRTYPYGAPIVAPEPPALKKHYFDGWRDLPQTMPAEDIVTEAVYVSKTLSKVTFQIGEEIVSELFLERGDRIVFPTPAEKEGYTFAGWEKVPARMGREPLLIRGMYRVNVHQVHFMWGETVYARQEVAYGQPIQLPPAPEPEGQVFRGWLGLPEQMPDEDVTVSADIISIYRLTFRVDEEVVEERHLLAGEPITPPAAPVKYGHTFGGWAGLPETAENNAVYQAVYTPNQHTVVFLLNGLELTTRKFAYGDLITTPDAPKKEQHIFTGWSGLPEFMPDEDLVVRALFEHRAMPIRFYVDNELLAEQILFAGDPITIPELSLKEGHDWSGWQDVPATVGEQPLTFHSSFTPRTHKVSFYVRNKLYYEQRLNFGEAITLPTPPTLKKHSFDCWKDLPELMPDRDIKLYAQLGPVRHNLRFLIDGAVVFEQQLPKGTPITPPELEEKFGYYFSGWGKVPARMPREDVVLEGRMIPKTRKLTFLCEDKVFHEQVVQVGQPIPLPKNPKIKNMQFLGWMESPEAMPDEDLVLKAQFISSFNTVKFMIGELKVAEKKLAMGERISFPPPPKQTGYTFAGWDNAPIRMGDQDLVVTGKFVANIYKVVFVVGGKTVHTQNVTFGEQIPLPEPPAKENYTFLGWQNLPQTMPAHDVRLTALFEPLFQVSFVIDHEVVSEKMLKQGDKIEAPTVTEKPGYDFSGWSKFPQKVKNSSLKIEGKYLPHVHKVTYLVHDKSFATKKIAYDDPVPVIDPPSVEAHTFLGWDGMVERMPDADLTVVAKYAPISYKATFMLGSSVVSEEMVPFGAPIPCPEVPEKVGYTFSGWQDVPEKMTGKPLLINGEYVPNRHTVTFRAGGKDYKQQVVLFGAPVKAPEEAPALKNHVFLGWANLPATMPDQDITIEANYRAVAFKATFLLDGSPVTEVDVPYGNKIPCPEVPERVGHTFGGWENLPETMGASSILINGTYTPKLHTVAFQTKKGKTFAEMTVSYGEAIPTPSDVPSLRKHLFKEWHGIPATMPDQDLVIPAVFEPISRAKHPVTFLVNGKAYGKPVKVKYGKSIPLPPPPSKDGYRFIRWDALPETMPGHPVTLNAVFEAAVYRVQFMLDGQLYQEATLPQGAPVPQPVPPEKEGYIFSGWQNYMAVMPEHDFVVSGNFKDKAYTVRYMVNGKLFKEQGYVRGEYITPEQAPAGLHSDFVQWQGLPAVMPARDLTVHASYEKKRFTVTYMLDNAVIKIAELPHSTPITPPVVPARGKKHLVRWNGMPPDGLVPKYDIVLDGEWGTVEEKLAALKAEMKMRKKTARVERRLARKEGRNQPTEQSGADDTVAFSSSPTEEPKKKLARKQKQKAKKQARLTRREKMQRQKEVEKAAKNELQSMMYKLMR